MPSSDEDVGAIGEVVVPSSHEGGAQVEAGSTVRDGEDEDTAETQARGVQRHEGNEARGGGPVRSASV